MDSLTTIFKIKESLLTIATTQIYPKPKKKNDNVPVPIKYQTILTLICTGLF